MFEGGGFFWLIGWDEGVYCWCRKVFWGAVHAKALRFLVTCLGRESAVLGPLFCGL